MPKSSPEKLAQALRANLKRRKQVVAPKSSEPPPNSAAQLPLEPPKTPTKTSG
jgi:hypothetical protein